MDLHAAHLKTERLILRPPGAQDAGWIARGIADPQVHRRLTAPPRPYLVADAVDWIAGIADQPGHFVIEEDGAPRGIVSCTLEDRDEHLGYWLCRDAWGRGIATEAAAAAIGWAISSGLSEVTSGYIAGNAASAHVLGKLGFQERGTARRYSAFHGAEVEIRTLALSVDAWSVR